jgi:imidazolonepropionase-like amidohydrolase
MFRIRSLLILIPVRLLLLTLLATYSLTAAAQTGTRPIVLQDVRLIDGTGTALRDHVSLLISDGKISRIVDARNASALPKGAAVIKLSGRTVMPGLIAGHAHLGLTEGAASGAGYYTVENIERQLA